ncbi:MAG: transcriptional repressor [Rhodospirillales bacterium]|nr:transcriptional repressor [Rhodospirillales bacterium]MDE2575912.1 transcriptional repressor [Rhodospirillales bacterium]
MSARIAAPADGGGTAIARRLDEAAAACAAQGAQLTALRRAVLGLILAAEAPLTAYRLLDLLKATRSNAAPPTIYRAVDFLLAQRLIHRIERINAFVGCTGGAHHAHPAQFLICRSCGGVAEIEDPAVSRALARAATRQGFRASSSVVEIEGVCAACAAPG